ncbi:uncharacterized protein LOC124451344 [Xenia sp. Carnegie-2017]|uniref:uncharacterized protein LOC124451344 n=1 Tax=Xenia sp. Carnegie-2017 TaxID=2897299 RepID=UPI001F03C97F|nr:uncharacterized protein LOC124451344 [Xenia sp. Carnegie-2017]
MTLSMFAVILEGPKWRVALQNAVRVDELKCKTVGGICECGSADLLSCNEVRYLALRYSINVIFSALSIIVCIFCSFIYFRILGWMVHVSPDKSIDDYYAKAFNTPFTNGNHERSMGRTNDVAMGTYPN